MHTAKTILLLAGLSALGQATLWGEVRPHSLFSDHMVLQREHTIPLRGEAAAGETVQVNWLGSEFSTTADSNGNWQINLPEQSAGGPYQMIISGSETAEPVVIRDILIGEVWLASGQSNMEWPLFLSDEATRNTAVEPQPQIRFYTVPKNAAATPVTDPHAAWVQATPQTAERFSAVAYVFAKAISDKLDVPVGIIQSTVGGTPVEAWTPHAAVREQSPKLWEERQAMITPFIELVQAGLAQGEDLNATHITEASEAVEKQWQQKVDALFQGISTPQTEWFSDGFQAQGWQTINLPGELESQMDLDTEGSFWVRITFQVPPALAGKAAILRLGPIDDFDETWLNGVKVGETLRDNSFAWITPRNYTVKSDTLKAGENVAIVRVIDHNLNAGFFAKPAEFYIEIEDGTAINLAGSAQAKLETSIGKKMSLPANDWQFAAGTLYDGMIAPLFPSAIRGVIWYQGENNVSRAAQYHSQFPLMIQSWRDLWQSELPFYYVQLAPWGDPVNTPADSALAELREAQLMTLRGNELGMVVTTDVGEAWDVHPRNKYDVGRRLASLALNRTYAITQEDSGPLYESMQIEDGSIRIHFSHTGGGLVAADVSETYPRRSETKDLLPLLRNSPHSQLEGFTICGADGRWQWANAHIDGDTVVVYAKSVSHPVAVRYGWADYPFSNLYNKEGFPASPFRTDNFPSITEGNK